MYIVNVIVSFIISSIFITSCQAKNVEGEIVESMKIVYYGGWDQFHNVPKLTYEITESKAKSLPAYFVGYYNDKNQLVRLEKYMTGNLFFYEEYSYYENGKLRQRKSWTNEKEKLDNFDETGKKIEENSEKSEE